MGEEPKPRPAKLVSRPAGMHNQEGQMAPKKKSGHSMPTWTACRLKAQELFQNMQVSQGRSTDRENPLWNGNQPYYDDFYAIWDTFRSSNPLITLISPSTETEIVNSSINIYKHDGYMLDAGAEIITAVHKVVLTPKF